MSGLWLADAAYHLGHALRSVGCGLAAAAWASVVTAHLELSADLRAYIGIGALGAGVATAQLFGGRPPSIARSGLAASDRHQAGDQLQVRQRRDSHS